MIFKRFDFVKMMRKIATGGIVVNKKASDFSEAFFQCG